METKTKKRDIPSHQKYFTILIDPQYADVVKAQAKKENTMIRSIVEKSIDLYLNQLEAERVKSHSTKIA